MTSDLDKLRKEIDRIDDELLAALERRAGVVQKVGALKGTAPVYRPEREAQILRRVVSLSRNLAGDRTAAIFREIISACRGLEEAIRVAYLGPEGTFSEQAVRTHFGSGVQGMPLPSVDDAFRSAESGATQFTVVPVENSTDGVVGRTLDLLTSTPLRICGEVELRVQQNLLSRQNALKGIKRVYSHSQSLAQTNGWLGKNLPKAARIPVASNAEAAQRAQKEKGAAAIAGLLAGERYKLNVLARSIEDSPDNTTRFLVLGDYAPKPSGRDKTSMILSARNRAGAVYEMLTPFATRGVSMTKFESRPSRVALWEYLFFVDIEGHRDDPQVAEALAEVGRIAGYIKVLGSYPAAVI